MGRSERRRESRPPEEKGVHPEGARGLGAVNFPSTANAATAELASVERCSQPEPAPMRNGRHHVACQRGAMSPFRVVGEHRPTRASRVVADGTGNRSPVWLRTSFHAGEQRGDVGRLVSGAGGCARSSRMNQRKSPGRPALSPSRDPRHTIRGRFQLPVAW
jgi:hypothetical protein